MLMPKKKRSLANKFESKEQSVGTFVKKLYNMVENESDAVVEWIKNGSQFHIKDSKTLCAHYLPKYFRHAKFSSLIRQLNFYSFYKVTEGNSIIYQHSFFRQGRPELLHHIKRRLAGKAKDPLVEPKRKSTFKGLAVSPPSRPVIVTPGVVDSMSPMKKSGMSAVMPPLLNIRQASCDSIKAPKKRKLDDMIDTKMTEVGYDALELEESALMLLSGGEKDSLMDDTLVSKECLKWAFLDSTDSETTEIELQPNGKSFETSSILWQKPLTPLSSPDQATWSELQF